MVNNDDDDEPRCRLCNHLEMVVQVFSLVTFVLLFRVPAAAAATAANEPGLESAHHPLRTLARAFQIAGSRPQPQRGQLARHEQGDIFVPGEIRGEAWKTSFRVDGMLATDGLEEGDQVDVVGFSGAVDDVVDWW